MGLWDIPSKHEITDTELRFNPYHDPTNGRFTTADGGGGYLFVGKGQKGNGTYVVSSEKFGNEFDYKIRTLTDRMNELDKKIEQAKKWGDEVYKDKLGKSNEILADASRKLEYKLNGYHKLIADRTEVKKQLKALERMAKWKIPYTSYQETQMPLF